ncbi:MAG: ABC transporter ATP-binding protein [Halobacteriales archaeon]
MSETQFSKRSAEENVVVEHDGTSVHYEGSRGQMTVVRDANVNIREGEIFAIVGESGSGKSMFASTMVDAVPEPGVVTGNVTYHPADGESTSILDLEDGELKELRWEEIAMVFQGAMSSFNPIQTIEEHFTETLVAHDYVIDEGMEKARQLLSDLYMEPSRVLDSYPHELSGGMRQRVLIALSLLLDPEVLIMDEPTGALDLLMQRSIILLVEEIKSKYDLTVVFITHDLPLAASLADRIGVMYAFDFIEIGATEDILNNAAHPYTRALFSATPNLNAPLDQMTPVEGSAPDPANTPDGCSYHPRCPLADDRCREVDPDRYDVDDDHGAACHYWEEAGDAIPYPTTERSVSDPDAHSGLTEHVDDRGLDDPLLSLRDLDVYFEQDEGMLSGLFGEQPAVEAVDGVDLDIHENDVFVVAGESGCGKTTLGKTAIGLQEPTDGTIEYRGQDIWDSRRRLGDVDIPYPEIRKSLQIIHQDPEGSLNAMRRVSAILKEPLNRWYDEFGSEDQQELIASMLEYVGLEPAEAYIDRYPHQLSGGEQQRIALVRAMLMEPDLILADEPVSALDVSLRVEMMDLLGELQDMFGTSYLLITHNLSNARYMAEMHDGRIAVMYLGRLVEVGSAEQIIYDPKHPYTKALRWAAPELDLEGASGEDVGESPVRKIDIADPSDAPQGCRYHTRCSDVIQPPGYEFEQEEWLSVLDLKIAVEDDELDYEALESDILDLEGVGEYPASELAGQIRDHYDIPRELTSSEADAVLERVIEHLLDDDFDAAASLTREEFSTICRQQDPTLEIEDDRPVACFLYSDETEATPL